MQANNSLPLLITFEEAARLLSVSLRTIQRMVRDGTFAAIRVTADAPRLRYADIIAYSEGK